MGSDNLVDLMLEFTENTEAPREYWRWACYMAIASLVGRRVYTNMGHFSILPNHYTILVSEPAIGTKSTVVAITRNLVAAAGAGSPLMSFSYQALLDALEENVESVKFPSGERMSISDISLFINELGTMLQTRDTEALDVLIHLWDGAPTARRTVSRGSTEIPNPCLNLFAGTTPSWLRDHLSQNMKEGGFLSRTPMIFAKEKERLVPWPDELIQDQSSLKKQIISRLKRLRKLRGEFEISSSAREFERSLYVSEYRENLNRGSNVIGYESRRQVHTIKLAMILSLAKDDSLRIDLREYEQAYKTVMSITKDIKSIIGTVEEHSSIRNVDRVYDALLKMFRSETAIYAKVQRNMSFREFKDALNDLESAGKVEKEGKKKGETQWRKKRSKNKSKNNSREKD